MLAEDVVACKDSTAADIQGEPPAAGSDVTATTSAADGTTAVVDNTNDTTMVVKSPSSVNTAQASDSSSADVASSDCNMSAAEMPAATGGETPAADGASPAGTKCDTDRKTPGGNGKDRQQKQKSTDKKSRFVSVKDVLTEDGGSEVKEGPGVAAVVRQLFADQEVVTSAASAKTNNHVLRTGKVRFVDGQVEPCRCIVDLLSFGLFKSII